jgi:hypothetical protein
MGTDSALGTLIAKMHAQHEFDSWISILHASEVMHTIVMHY